MNVQEIRKIHREVFREWSDLELLAAVIWAEAGGEEFSGKVGVGLTVQTRVFHPRWWGHNWREVILCPYQFCCFNPNNPRFKPLSELRFFIPKEEKRAYEESQLVAKEIYLGRMADYIGQPTHYHTLNARPLWALSPNIRYLCRIGKHKFYSRVKV